MAIRFNESRFNDNSFTAFKSLIKSTKDAPSINNLYGVEFGQPRVLVEQYGNALVPYGRTSGRLALMLNHYAASVATPSRNLTTATVNNIGSAYKYATGQSHSEINIQFIMPRSLQTYTFFDRWINLITNDTTQHVDLLENYTCTMKIYKMERGAGKKRFYTASDLIKEQQNEKNKSQKTGFYYENDVTGCWALADVFPYNLGQVDLQSGQGNYTTFNVGFQYRNFRFYPNNKNVDLTSNKEKGKSPKDQYLKSLDKQAQKFFKESGIDYSEFLGNLDLNPAVMPEFNFGSNFGFSQPPGTEPLNFWGNTSPQNNS